MQIEDVEVSLLQLGAERNPKAVVKTHFVVFPLRYQRVIACRVAATLGVTLVSDIAQAF